MNVVESSENGYKQLGLIGLGTADFRACLTAYDTTSSGICLPAKTRDLLKIDLDQSVFVTPFEYGKKSK